MPKGEGQEKNVLAEEDKPLLLRIQAQNVLHHRDARRQTRMARFEERGAYDDRLGLGREVLLPDHDREMFGDVGVEYGAVGVSCADGAGDLLLDRQDARIDG